MTSTLMMHINLSSVTATLFTMDKHFAASTLLRKNFSPFQFQLICAIYNITPNLVNNVNCYSNIYNRLQKNKLIDKKLTGKSTITEESHCKRHSFGRHNI